MLGAANKPDDRGASRLRTGLLSSPESDETSPSRAHPHGSTARRQAHCWRRPTLHKFTQKLPGKRTAPEFEAWLERMGITDAAGRVSESGQPRALPAPLP